MPDDRPVVKMPNYLDANGVPTCPQCGCQDTRVETTYPWHDGRKRRRRYCKNNNCGWAFPCSVEVFDETV